MHWPGVRAMTTHHGWRATADEDDGVNRIWRTGVAMMGLAGLAACQSNPLEITRSYCPAVSILRYAETATLLKPGAVAGTADALDMTVQFSQAVGHCKPEKGKLIVPTSVRVTAVRRDATAERTVELPLFVAVTRNNEAVLSKQVIPVQLRFAAGSPRAEASASSTAIVDEAAARKAAAPLQATARDNDGRRIVEARVTAAPYEVVWGFQLNNADVAYNLTN